MSDELTTNLKARQARQLLRRSRSLRRRAVWNAKWDYYRYAEQQFRLADELEEKAWRYLKDEV